MIYVRNLTTCLLLLIFIASPLSVLYAQEVNATEANTDQGPTTSTEAQDNSSGNNDSTNSNNASANANNTDNGLTKEQTKAIKDLDKRLKKEEITQKEYDELKAEIIGQPIAEEALMSQSFTIEPEYKTLGKYIEPEISTANGSLNYEYPIVVPRGRNGLTPEVSLVYSSLNKNSASLVGYGWSINIPYIQRVNRTGTNNLYSESYFTSSLDGELIDQGSGVYTPRVENGNYLKYEFASSTWTVTDKSGTKYKFGETASARQDNPSDSSEVFAWMLEEVIDTNDNTIDYNYYKNQGQIYPSTISYNQDGLYEVTFNRTANSINIESYEPAFEVVTAYRIDNIVVETNATTTMEYDLSITDNQVQSITATGYDGTQSVALPAVDIDYSSETEDIDYVRDTSIDLPHYLSGDDKIALSVGGTTKAFVDINGDGLTDLISSGSNAYETDANGGGLKDPYGVWISSGNGYERDENIGLPYYLSGSDKIGIAMGGSTKALVDVNGDGLIDVVSSSPTAYNTAANGGDLKDPYGIWINDGDGFTKDTSFDVPYYLSGSDKIAVYAGDSTKSYVDINGDGLTDFISSGSNAYNTAANGGALKDPYGIWINDGDGFIKDTSFDVPYYLSGSDKIGLNVSDSSRTLSDINGDGLADLISSNQSAYNTDANGGDLKDPYGVWINTGLGFEKDTTMDVPYYLSGSDKIGLYVGGVTKAFADVNGDRLADLISSGSNAYETAVNGGALKDPYGVWINTGDGFSRDTSIDLPYYLSGSDKIALNVSEAARAVADINGDGLADFISSYESYYYPESSGGELKDFAGIWINTGSTFAEISEITDSKGGSSAFTYTNASLQDSSNAVPFPVFVVDSVTTDDNNGVTHTTDYEYRNASFYFNTAIDKKFAGFGKIMKTDEYDVTETTYYHQADGSDTNEPTDSYARMGKLYKTEITDSSDDLYSRQVNVYGETSLGNNAYAVHASSTLMQYYDGTTSHTDTAVSYAYDSYGNETSQTQYGVVSGSEDGTFTDTGSDKRVITHTYTNDTTNYIVGLPTNETLKNNGGTTIKETDLTYDTVGNLTEESRWISGSNYSDTNFEYNSYGLVATSTDALGNKTIYTYDSNNLYPSTITNALAQATAYTYDYSSGKPTQVVESNGRTTDYIYDGLDRLTQVKETIGNNSFTTLTREITYNSTSTPQYKKETIHRNSTDSQDIYTYVDGFDRVIQTKEEMDNNWKTVDTVYDKLGRVSKKSLPYETTSGASSAVTTTTALLATSTYDPLNRVLTSVNAKGTTSHSYDGFETTVTDPESNVKDFTTDAFENLIQVDEHNGASTYTTEYEYTADNLLSKITDEDNNLRNISYDGIGRRTALEDLHSSSDSTFGTWSFTYDDLNLVSMTDPKSVTTSYTYDDLNRVLTENIPGGNTDVTYAYDSCTNGSGFLCSVTTDDVTTTYTYFKQGKEQSLIDEETRTIDSTDYTTTHDYNYLGETTDITYPDGSTVEYFYNTRGLVDDIEFNNSSLVTYTYGVHGLPVTQTHANSVVSTYTYDADELYELTNKTTEDSGSDELQNLNYTYDSVGNITQIADYSSTGAAKTVSFGYDDLYRLTTASTTVASSTPYSRTYAYDPLGNITSFNGSSYSYTDNGYNNPHAVTSIASTTITYDNNGNMTSDGTWTNTWDYRNRLLSSSNGSAATTYGYDHNDQRVIKTVDSVDTIYPNMYYNVSGATTTRHIFTPTGDLVATVESNGTATTTNHLHTDHLGGTNVVTNSSGTVQEVTDYYPYGEQRINTGSFTEQRKFTGHEYDTETSLSYMGARYYAGDTGRFTSQDPISLALGDWKTVQDKTDGKIDFYLQNPQTHNSYSYTANNPLKYVDKNGEFIAQVLLGLFIPNVAGAPDVGQESTIGSGAESAIFVAGFAAPSGKAQKASQIAQNQLKGSAFEKTFSELSGLAKNTDRIESISKTANFRIPDFIDKAGNLIETKNVNVLRPTNQIKDMAQHAQNIGKNFTIVTAQRTQISNQLKQIQKSLNVVIKKIKDRKKE